MAADSLNSKTAFIAIVGCPNVGKSSLLNRFLGEKVAIVSPKPQTTRTRIMGVLTDGATQLVFTDTPGYHKPKNKLGENMIRAVGEGINDVDACLLVVEPSGDIRPEEQTLIKKIKKAELPAVLAINKIDTVENKEELLARISLFAGLYDFNAIVPVSAVDGNGLDALISELKSLAMPSEHLFRTILLLISPKRS